jgi:linoleoyl-CoA desaturase
MLSVRFRYSTFAFNSINMTIPKFANGSGSIHAEMKKRINEYFTKRGKSATGNFRLWLKAGILITGLLTVYIHLIFFTPPTFWAILECLLMGVLTAAIGFNVMHDGAHGSFSKYKWVNQMAAVSVNLLGADNFMWRNKHNIIHHTYTNIEGVDDDIEARPFLRLAPEQKFYKIYKFQYLYFWMAYSLLYIWWIFVTDYKKYFMKRIGAVALQKMKWYNHVSFWTFKAIHAFLFVVLPIIVVGPVAWLIGFLTFALFAGLVLSIVFQLAHTVEHTHFPVPNEATGKMEDEWAIHQLKTTANFATKNKIVSWFVGGLNFQIEHHLFPKISHVHYPAISKIIKQVCQEYGITYIEYPKVRLAVASHIAFLRQMGKA